METNESFDESLSKVCGYEGYVWKHDHNDKTVILCDKQDINEKRLCYDVPVGVSHRPCSALTFSMWPQDIFARINNSQLEYRFDEFGYKIDEKNCLHTTAEKLLNISFVEDSQLKFQWYALLNSNSNKKDSEPIWQNVDIYLACSDKLRQMVYKGIPHSIRPEIWMRISGALKNKLLSERIYEDIIKASSTNELITNERIEKDILKTLPDNVCYSESNSTGILKLRRVMQSLAWLYPENEYCQESLTVAASLLLFFEEEDAFWMMATIVKDLLPVSYYSNAYIKYSTLIRIQVDQRVLRTLIANFLPNIEQILIEYDIDLNKISFNWFVTLFASIVHMNILLRLWDLFLLDGSIVLFQVILGMLKMKETELKDSKNQTQVINALSNIFENINDIDKLLKVSLEVSKTLNNAYIDTHRKQHLAFLKTDQPCLVKNTNILVDSKEDVQEPISSKKYECVSCEKTFVKRSQLLIHYKIHSEQKDFVCDICKKRFTQKGNLNAHIQTHSGIKNYLCSLCNKSFLTKSQLKTHTNIHTKNSKFMCDICDKVFCRKSHLESHLTTHSNVRNIQCTICKKSFKQKEYLKIHLRIHSNEKKFVCKICTKSFVTKSNYNRHVRTHNKKK